MGFFSGVLRESSQKWISDTWIPRKKKPTSRKVHERNGEREEGIKRKSYGFWQQLMLYVSSTRGCGSSRIGDVTCFSVQDAIQLTVQAGCF